MISYLNILKKVQIYNDLKEQSHSFKMIYILLIIDEKLKSY